MTEIIGKRAFDISDLLAFAAASGDWNPIHVDPAAARRLIAGGVVVHGMFTLLSALDHHFAASGRVPRTIAALFHKPILLDEEVIFLLEGIAPDVRISVQRDGEPVATVLLKGAGAACKGDAKPARPSREDPCNHSFSDLRSASGSLEVSACLDDLEKLFPHVLTELGGLAVAGIMAFSRIVGMKCPGLHSLFTGLEIKFAADTDQPCLDWTVIRHTAPYAPLKLAANGAGMSANLTTFMRPAPVAQPSVQTLASIVEAGTFDGQHALIIGGSRGLGELVAKLVAVGGGNAIITYANGRRDAERVANEITSDGGRCNILHLDVTDRESIAKRLNDIPRPTHLYYFATPRIFAQRSGVFDDALYRSFQRIYVDGFETVVKTLSQGLTGRLFVYYPSTVYVDQQPAHFAEYAAAKRDAEALCKELGTNDGNIRILLNRLPPLQTDQTASLLPSSAKSALDEMRQVAMQMHSLGGNKQ
jgi:NAD(P)-dependent dehydrogenase (short-subunit alcohol dehydrogenase family)